MATLLSTQPMPRGRRVALLTNAGGLGILCADACEAAGLELPLLGEDTIRAIAPLLPEEASLANPVDMLGSASEASYESVLPLLLADPGVDAVIALFVPAVSASAEGVAAAIARAAAASSHEKPVLAVVMSAGGIPEALRQDDGAAAAFTFPESAARALGRAAERADWLRRPLGSVAVARTTSTERLRSSSSSARSRSRTTAGSILPTRTSCWPRTGFRWSRIVSRPPLRKPWRLPNRSATPSS